MTCSGDVYTCSCLSCGQQRRRIHGKNRFLKSNSNKKFADVFRGTEMERIDNSRVSFAIVDGRIIRL